MTKGGNETLRDRYMIEIRRRADGTLELLERGSLGMILGDSAAELLVKLLERQAEELHDTHARLRAVDTLFQRDAVTAYGEFADEVSLEQVGRMIRSITHDLDSHPGFVERLAGFIDAGGFAVTGPAAAEVPLVRPTKAERLAEAATDPRSDDDAAMVAALRELRRVDPAAWEELERDIHESVRRLDGAEAAAS